MTGSFRHRFYGLFCAAALLAWLAVGGPAMLPALGGRAAHAVASPLWLLPYLAYGLLLAVAMLAPIADRTILALAALLVACVIGMAVIEPGAVLAVLLVPVAWLVALRIGAAGALLWVGGQSLALVVALAQIQPSFAYCYILGLATALQLFFVFTAHALRSEAEAARALARSNLELRAAQAMLASNVRAAERTRISRELHDAWGHELTALGLQLEIASHVVEDGRARDGVTRARALASDLLVKVRDVVSTLREEERCDLREALETLARSVPAPAIHVALDPDLPIGPAEAHTLMRCAQEAVTNAVRHAEAANLWLSVRADAEGVRLIARDDGRDPPRPRAGGSGIAGMRERLETLGGRLEVRAEGGFTLDAWLPSAAARAGS